MVDTGWHRASLAGHWTAAGMTSRKGRHHHDKRPQRQNQKLNNMLDHDVPLLDGNPRRNHVTPQRNCGTDR
jgi:hypothetical protein